MKLYDVIWKIRFIEKISGKHNVTTDEVEDVLFGKSHFRRAQKGHIKGEDLYTAYGQTAGGRYLIVFLFERNKQQRCPFQPVT
jgi:uncharacterized DUF497 family protein